MDMDLDYPYSNITIGNAQLAVVDATLLAVAGRLWELELSVAPQRDQRTRVTPPVEKLRTSRLGQDLLLIADYARNRWVPVPRVECAMERVYRALFGDCLGDGYMIPPQFYKTELGKLFHEAYSCMYDPEDLLTPVQVYRALGIARQSLYDRAREGKLHPIYFYGETRFLRSEVEAWKAQRERRKKVSEDPG